MLHFKIVRKMRDDDILLDFGFEFQLGNLRNGSLIGWPRSKVVIWRFPFVRKKILISVLTA